MAHGTGCGCGTRLGSVTSCTGQLSVPRWTWVGALALHLEVSSSSWPGEAQPWLGSAQTFFRQIAPDAYPPHKFSHTHTLLSATASHGHAGRLINFVADVIDYRVEPRLPPLLWAIPGSQTLYNLLVPAEDENQVWRAGGKEGKKGQA